MKAADPAADSRRNILIYPTLNFANGVFSKDKAFYFRAGLVNKAENGALSLAHPCERAADPLVAADGAVLKRAHTGKDAIGFNFELLHHHETANFTDCLLISFADGWLVLKETDTPKFIAYNYLEQRRLEFNNARVRGLHHAAGFFFEEGRRGWVVYDHKGTKVCECAVVSDGDRPDNAIDLLRMGDTVYLGTGGENGAAFLVPFSLSRGTPGPQIERPSGYVFSTVQTPDGIFFADRSGIFKAASDDLLLAEKIAAFDPDQFKGTLLFWHNEEALYAASCGADLLNSYGPDGTVVSSVVLPSRWKFWLGNPAHLQVAGGHSLVYLCPEDYHQWGYGAFLSIPAGTLLEQAIFEEESLQSLDISQTMAADGSHGYRMKIGSVDAEVATRHAAHHLASLVNKVAVGLMNSGFTQDKNFNGTLELELVTPQPIRRESLHMGYLEELFRQMQTTPQSYNAGNRKGPLHLSVFWHADAGEPEELVFSST